MGKTLDLVRPLVDKTLERLAVRKFKEDPLLGPDLSRKTSLASSAQRRHGHILEAAMICRLKQIERFTVWSDPKFAVSSVADNMVNGAKPETLLGATAPYGDQHRTLQVDAFVYDRDSRKLAAFEIKRGNDHHDSGKKRSMLRDLVCVQVLMKAYGENSYGLEIASAESRAIFYYGACTVGAPFALTRGDLDAYFGESVVADIEEVNDYLRENLMRLLVET